MVTLNCALCGSKILRFIKEQEAIGLSSSLGIRPPLSKTRVLCPILFQRYKMNEIINKFLLARDNFMPEMYLRLRGFTQRGFPCLWNIH